MNIDKVGDHFSLSTFLQARKICIETTNEIISSFEEGMTQKDCEALVKNKFEEKGIDKFWHPTKVRIGPDTLKSFREISNPNSKIVKNSICFIDVGPIWEGHEADFGRTFIFGAKSNKIIESSELVFKNCVLAWKNFGKTGAELLEIAKNEASNMGFELNENMSGHRIGDFPHKIHSNESLFKSPNVPTVNLWVLEIHLLDKANQQGAFYEDIIS